MIEHLIPADMDEKMEIIQRLVRDGSIDLAEALVLLEKQDLAYPAPVWPQQQPYPYQPYDPIVQPRITWDSGVKPFTLDISTQSETITQQHVN